MVAIDDASLSCNVATIDSAVLEVDDGNSCALANAKELVAVQGQRAELDVGGVNAELRELKNACTRVAKVFIRHCNNCKQCANFCVIATERACPFFLIAHTNLIKLCERDRQRRHV